MPRTSSLVVGASILALASGLTYYGVRRNETRKADLPDDDRDLRADVQVQEREITSPDGAVLVASEAGDPAGPTVVLAHCWTGSQIIWTPVTRRLVRAGCRVIRWDQRGHGRSSVGSLGCTVEEAAAILKLARSTVDNHKVRAMKRLGTNKAALQTRIAIKRRITSLNDRLTRAEKRRSGRNKDGWN